MKKKKTRKNWFILLKCVSCKHEVAFTLELLSQLAHERKRQDMVCKLLPQKAQDETSTFQSGINALNLAIYIGCI